mgnify:FL=1
MPMTANPEFILSNNEISSSFSSADTCRPTVGCAMSNALAVADSDPSYAVTKNASARFQSNLITRLSIQYVYPMCVFVYRLAIFYIDIINVNVSIRLPLE